MTPTRDLDVYEIAWLAGGRARVVETALVALVQTGRVRVRPPSAFAAVSPARRHPVEAAVLDAVGTCGHRSIDTVRWRLADDERVLGLGHRLRERRLLTRVGRTPAGRHLLHALARDADTGRPDGTDALLVALGGPRVLHHGELRAALIAPPRAVAPLHRRSRSSDRREAAAEARDEARRTAAVLHGRAAGWIAPSGPAARP